MSQNSATFQYRPATCSGARREKQVVSVPEMEADLALIRFSHGWFVNIAEVEAATFHTLNSERGHILRCQWESGRLWIS